MNIVNAIFRRDMKRWFSNPTGYVFIALFAFLAASAMFWLDDSFFNNNLANLAPLNAWFPRLLLLLIPAITMTVWAGERSQGTDELLLTLPASDGQIILGKFLAAVGIFTVSLVFCFPLLLMLGFLGDPDWGLMIANFAGYWFLGVTLLSLGMVGSQLSDNLTIAFILGMIFCGVVVIFVDVLLPDSLARYTPVAMFQEMGRGVISLTAVMLFAGITFSFLYLNRVLLSRRHWRADQKEGLHLSARFVSLLVAAISVTLIGANYGARGDITSEKIHSLSSESRRIVSELDPERPVYIQAFVTPSEDIPRDFIRAHRTLLDLLAEFDSIGGDDVRLRLVETSRFSDEAREAEERFDISHRTVGFERDGLRDQTDLFMGLAFTCGLQETVIPFLEPTIPIEYELCRSIRMVSSAERRKIGVLDNDAQVFGTQFDFQSGARPLPQWRIIRELELQYEVERVAVDAPYPTDLDVLVAPLPSSLAQEEMDRLEEAILGGQATLLIDDPWPWHAPGCAPSDQKGGPQNPFQQNQAPPVPKGNIDALMRKINLRWPKNDVVWASYNPHPELANAADPEILWISPNSGAAQAFNDREDTVSGLQELVVIYGGTVTDAGRDGLSFTPLCSTARTSGAMDIDDVIQRGMPPFSQTAPRPGRQYRPDRDEHVVAASVKGKNDDGDINVAFFADLDMISDMFWTMRAGGAESALQLDNVTFLLNVVDALAGDESFIELRKRRPKHRTLTEIEEYAKDYHAEWLEQKEAAVNKAEGRLKDAQDSLDAKVAKIDERTDLDEQSKAIQKDSVREVEQRKLNLSKARIEDEKERALEDAKAEKLAAEQKLYTWFKTLGIACTPLPAVLVGILAFVRRRAREQFTLRSATKGA